MSNGFLALQDAGTPCTRRSKNSLKGNSRDQQRFIIFLSDGKDESSVKGPADIISAAQSRGIKIYCIGFGEELDSSILEMITCETSGEYYTAESEDDLTTQFQQIIHDLGGQYSLRWATLKRDASSFTPSFSIKLNGFTDTYSSNEYTPFNHSGNTLQGTLRFAASQPVNNKVTAYLRVEYVPRYIRKIKLFLKTEKLYTVSLAPKEIGGLCWDWPEPLIEVDEESGGQWITIQSANPDSIFTSIPYGAFGTLLIFEFSDINPGDSLFEQGSGGMFVDIDIYNETGGQSFRLVDTPFYNPSTGESGQFTVPLDLPSDAYLLDMILIPAGVYMMGISFR